MYRVIECIPIDIQAIQNLPDWTLGPGLMVNLDVKEPEGSIFFEADSTVRVHRPDGTFIDCEVTGAGWSNFMGEKKEQNISLFFPKLNKHDIPRLSRIQPFPSVVPESPE